MFEKRPRGRAGNAMRVFYHKDLKPGDIIRDHDGRTTYIIASDGSRRRFIPPPAPDALRGATCGTGEENAP